jgi:glycosyltransferase involved in cell wall biosynthesis
MTLSPAQLDATIVIVSKNRVDELRRALQSAMIQHGASIEILVMDDGSTDGTSEMVRREFPSAAFHRSEQSLGLVVERNRAAQLARGSIIVSIDDDATFSTPDVVAQTLQDFDDPRIGVVAIPFIDKNRSESLNQTAPSRSGTYVTQSFVGTAYAIRRDMFLNISGFRDDIVHQGEEGDFAIRMLECGFFVRLGRADPIFHFESPKRDWKRMCVYGWRNIILFSWRYVPFPYLTIRLAATLANGLIHSARRCELHWFGLAVVRALRMIVLGPASMRCPVRRRTYRLFRRLRKDPLAIQNAADFGRASCIR